MTDDELTGVLADLQDELEGSYCTGWILLTEWIDEDGERKLSARKSVSLTDWTAGGIMHHVLYHGGTA